MSEKQNRIDALISAEELPSFLRSLAEALEGKPETGGIELPAGIEDFKKIKLALKKSQSGQVSIKLRLKTMAAEQAGEEDETDDEQDKRYKKLKKSMKKTWKKISKKADEGLMPPAETVERFLRESDEMVSYEGFGDEHYEEYATACRQLKAAHEGEQIEPFRVAFTKVESIKKVCHSKYK